MNTWKRRTAAAARAPLATTLSAITLLAGFTACRRQEYPVGVGDPPVLPVVAALDAPPGGAVLAQGRLEPAGGVVPIVVAVGDRIESIAVSAGDAVSEGQAVGRLEGHRLRIAELAVAQAQLAEGEARVKAEAALARANLQVAQVGVKRNEMQLAEAQRRMERANADGGQLELLRRRVALAEEKLAQLRLAAAEPDNRRLVSETAVQQQALVAEAAQAELESARRELETAVEVARLTLEASTEEFAAAQLAVESSAALAPLDSLRKKVELLELQVQAAELTSPIDGVVLAIDMAPGQPTTGMPVMRIADTSRMICRAEVPVAELTRIEIGADARIGGGGFEEILSGHVESISRMIGSPQFANPNPMAGVDWRSATVIITLDPDDVDRAAQRVHAQVDVAIRAEPD